MLQNSITDPIEIVMYFYYEGRSDMHWALVLSCFEAIVLARYIILLSVVVVAILLFVALLFICHCLAHLANLSGRRAPTDKPSCNTQFVGICFSLLYIKIFEPLTHLLSTTRTIYLTDKHLNVAHIAFLWKCIIFIVTLCPCLWVWAINNMYVAW